LKKIILLFTLLCAIIYPQTEYERTENPVYGFLERMEALKFLPLYNKFEIPKTRKEIAGYILQIINKRSELDNADNDLLGDLIVEFGFDLVKTTDYMPEDTSIGIPMSIIGDSNFDLFSENEKYLFFYEEKGKANLFASFFADGEYLSYKKDGFDNLSSFIGNIGGEIRGTILNNFGFYIRGSNGNAFGDKEAAFQKKELQYNYKFNEKPEETFFDATEGYLTADFDLVKFKIGRDRLNIGYGMNKPLLGNSAPIFDYISLKLDYKFLSFSFFHGKLLGNNSVINDTVSGPVNYVDDKYIAYHRLGFNLSDDFDFGVGEIVIYGERSIDLSYLNPFSFYKSVEHSNRDRDNAMLFADFNNNTIKGINFYSTLLLDDINFGKIGKGWWGNEVLFNAGIYSSILYKLIPVDIQIDYLRIEPYTYSHRLLRNNYTNYSYKMGSDADPNSEVIAGRLLYRFNHRLNASAGFLYSVHGANPTDESGNVLKNVGGDIAFGHRLSDSETLSFLEGELEYKRNISFSLTYEPVNQYSLGLFVDYTNESLQHGINNIYVTTILALSIKI
jgi:hypothetical protein